MHTRRVGLWLIGALGGVAGTLALGLAALRRGLAGTTALTTALPLFDGLDLDDPGHFVLGGHDIRRSNLRQTVLDLHQRAQVFDRSVVEACQADLDLWSENIRPGTVLQSGDRIASLAEIPDARGPDTSREVIARLQDDMRAFQERHRLAQVVVINVASTEPPFEVGEVHSSVDRLAKALSQGQPVLPSSSLYSWAALELGLPYINFTPSLGASAPALEELAARHGAVCAGKDGKTGETLLKSVLAPMFACRNLEVLSWVGHNIFGNRDGLVLDDPANKESKLRTKDAVVSQILGYWPQTHVSIEYIPSLDDWKTAWDHVHFRGFLDVKMNLQFTWQGCDSVLAAPLVIDLARLTLLSQRRGEVGVLRHLACFFKSPMGVTEHNFFRQFGMLVDYVTTLKGGGPAK